MEKELLKKKIQSIIQLPALPAIAIEIINMVEDPRTSASMLGRVISKDQVLTAKVLKIANSPFYGFSRKIATIDFAIIVLGFDTLKEVVMSVSLISSLSKKLTREFNSRQFWDHSIACGVIARALARNHGYRVIGEVFIAGLLHDIGILIINQYLFNEYKEIVKLIKQEKISLEDAEMRVLGVTHGEIGSWLAEKWNFPGQLVDTIAFHHHPIQSEQYREIVSIIHMADVLCQKLDNGYFELEKDINLDTQGEGMLNLQDFNLTEDFVNNYRQIFEEEIEKSRIFIP
ncbi:MAG TPA: HDOD domain-containing protein [Bacteroidota bacterium]|nr:HDOD domain-containing protein [Bacteroidota bacterium]